MKKRPERETPQDPYEWLIRNSSEIQGLLNEEARRYADLGRERRWHRDVAAFLAALVLVGAGGGLFLRHGLEGPPHADTRAASHLDSPYYLPTGSPGLERMTLMRELTELERVGDLEGPGRLELRRLLASWPMLDAYRDPHASPLLVPSILRGYWLVPDETTRDELEAVADLAEDRRDARILRFARRALRSLDEGPPPLSAQSRARRQ